MCRIMEQEYQDGYAEGLKEGMEKGMEQGLEKGIAATISSLKYAKESFDEVVEIIVENFQLDEMTAKKKVELYC